MNNKIVIYYNIILYIVKIELVVNNKEKKQWKTLEFNVLD